MSIRNIHSAFAVLALVAACGERVPPTAVDESGPSFVRSGRPAAEQQRLERLARRVARALADPAFRGRVKDELARSPFREGKLHFQRFVTAGQRPVAAEIARLNREPEGVVRADALDGVTLELYLPVVEHRTRWNGSDDVLVATALADADAPVAFDVRGRRHVLSAAAPPHTPVIALVPAETNFDRVEPQGCVEPYVAPGRIGATCGGGGGSPTIPGVYMVKSHLNETFEGWLKGSPEIEILVLGQKGSTDSLTRYQCVGERVAAPYNFNQDNKDWTGGVLLFSQSQLDAYKAAHGGQGVRFFFMEDDDASCEIKNDPNRLKTLFGLVDQVTQGRAAGRDTTLSPTTRVLTYWNIWSKIYAAIASLINSNDDLIGNAVKDVTVSEFYPGYNWIIRNDANQTKGYVYLELRR